MKVLKRIQTTEDDFRESTFLSYQAMHRYYRQLARDEATKIVGGFITLFYHSFFRMGYPTAPRVIETFEDFVEIRPEIARQIVVTDHGLF